MKIQTPLASDSNPSIPLRDLLRGIPVSSHEADTVQKITGDQAESLKKSASLSTCDTFNAGFLAGIFLAPSLRK